MTSRISGPIPSHEVYYSPRASVYSSRGIRSGSIGQSESRFGASMNALDLLQWQSNSSSMECTNYSQSLTSHSNKNYIRENIRRLRQMQTTPPVKRVPYAASFVPIARPYKVSPESPNLPDPLPPRPNTAMPRCSHENSMEKQMPRVKTASTDTTSIQWPNDSGEGYHEEFVDDDLCTECRRPSNPDPLPPRFVDRPSSPVRQSNSTRETVTVECRGTQCSIKPTKVLAPTRQKNSQGVQVTSRLCDSIVQRKNPDPVSGAKAPEQEKPKRDKGKVSHRNVRRRSRTASAGPVRHDFMRAHAKTTDGEWDLRLLGTIPLRKVNRSPRPEQLTVPKASSAKSVQLIRRDINYVRANAHLATTPLRAMRVRSAMASRSNSPQPIDDLGKSSTSRSTSGPGGDSQIHMWPQRRLPVGSLPTYLIRRRQEQRDAAARARANQPDPDQPPGHQKMPEEERKDTLELLQKAHHELSQEWARLPIRTDTLRIRNRRTELEQRLADLEEAINIFNKPKVFIKPE